MAERVNWFDTEPYRLFVLTFVIILGINVLIGALITYLAFAFDDYSFYFFPIMIFLGASALFFAGFIISYRGRPAHIGITSKHLFLRWSNGNEINQPWRQIHVFKEYRLLSGKYFVIESEGVPDHLIGPFIDDRIIRLILSDNYIANSELTKDFILTVHQDVSSGFYPRETITLKFVVSET